MLTYELAKRLKDGGFPQIGSNQDGYTNEGGYEPSLSELIESFGDVEIRLIKEKGTHVVRCHAIIGDHSGHGESLEEAAAELWLIRNKK